MGDDLIRLGRKPYHLDKINRKGTTVEVWTTNVDGTEGPVFVFHASEATDVLRKARNEVLFGPRLEMWPDDLN